MSKRIAIVQSNYIPWKGYFDLINMVDEFYLFDFLQYTRRDWRNRNKIKTPHVLLWLSIPVECKGKWHQRICETRVSDPQWGSQHWKTIQRCYAKAPYFQEYKPFWEELYLGRNSELLSDINYRFLSAICELLGITTKLIRLLDYDESTDKTERLIRLCQKFGATEYLSGPAAQNYCQPELFAANNIALRWMDYSGYPEYPQLYPPFEHAVSIVDLILNAGPNAPRYMKSFGGQAVCERLPAQER